MEKKPDLDGAYALQTPADNQRLYAQWADSYDQDFAQDMDYRLPFLVADAYSALGVNGAVLDVGAGTGLVGAQLRRHGIGPIHGADISPEMLATAQAKGHYEKCFISDVTQPLNLNQTYAGAVSAGTFTHGHVGPNALANILQVIRPGGWLVASVNARHWSGQGFDAALAEMSHLIGETRTPEVAIYGASASGEHGQDRAILLHLRRA